MNMNNVYLTLMIPCNCKLVSFFKDNIQGAEDINSP